MKLLAELKRRNVFRMAGLYLVAAWLAVQVAATLLPVFEAPPWVMKSLVVLLAIGFAVSLVFSWIYELTPAGLQLESELAADEDYQGPDRRRRRLRRISDRPIGEELPARGRLQDRLIIVLLLLAVGYFLTDKFLLQRSPETRPAADASAPPAQKAGGLIAVLPFRNRSPLPEDAYFAEGIHDDLLTQLAKISSLKVISRTSMLRYADTGCRSPRSRAYWAPRWSWKARCNARGTKS